jgi:ketopantoate reductase
VLSLQRSATGPNYRDRQEEKLLLRLLPQRHGLGPAALHGGRGMTFMGEPGGGASQRVEQVAAVFNQAGIEVTATTAVMKEIWAKLALNVCTLPTSALLRFCAPLLIQHSGTINLMEALLRKSWLWLTPRTSH